MLLGDPLKPSCKTSYSYQSCPQISEQSVQWLLSTRPDKIWADFDMPLGDPLSPLFWILNSLVKLHIYIYPQISEQFVLWLLRTCSDKMGEKKKLQKKNKKWSKNNKSPHFIWET